MKGCSLAILVSAGNLVESDLHVIEQNGGAPAQWMGRELCFYIQNLEKYLYMNDYLYKYWGIIIKQTAVKVLDDRDQEIIKALRGLKVPKSAAALITYLANVSEATSREIEMGTNLRQPEVSLGMSILNKNKWVTEREVKIDRRGRPKKVYRLSIPIEKIVEHYEEEKGRESALTMEAIQRLKEMATN